MQDTKLRGWIQLCFYTSRVNNLKRGIRETIPLSKASESRRKIRCRNKFNSGRKKMCALEMTKHCSEKELKMGYKTKQGDTWGSGVGNNVIKEDNSSEEACRLCWGRGKS